MLRTEMEAIKTNASISTRKQVEKLERKIEELTQTNSHLTDLDEIHKKEVRKSEVSPYA